MTITQRSQLYKLINSGTVFGNVWAYPFYSPTPKIILTGKYGFRTGINHLDIPLSTGEASLQQELKDKTVPITGNVCYSKWSIGRSKFGGGKPITPP